MRDRKATLALAALAVCGALVLGGCGGGDESSTSGEPAKATTPASQVSAGQASKGEAMKDDDAMKQHGDAMKDDDGSMDQGEAMKHDGAMKGDDGAMHDEGDDHGEAMKDG